MKISYNYRGYDPVEVCRRGLQWSKEQEYTGYDPYDGLNSPFLSYFSTNWFTRLIAIHGVHKSPINLRPLLRIPKERNPKGIALFSMAYLNEYSRSGRSADYEEAKRLLQWLNENRAPGYEDAAWGYNFDWQNAREFFLPAYEPSIVVTVFCARAFLRYYETTGEQWALRVAQSASDFILTHINQVEVKGFDVFTYTPHDSFVLVNTNALAANFFYLIAQHSDEQILLERATELFDFVIYTQTSDGGWYYSVPASKSHLDYDNFHTGFVLESLHDYATDQPEMSPARETYLKGLRFYQKNLFEEDGAPRFEADQRYPHDAHASAQAIITFSQRESDRDRQLAELICQWSIEHLYHDDGYFYRRIGRVLTDDTPYMRWSQAWMCRALSKLNLRISEDD